MQLDKNKILGEVQEHFGSKNYADGSYGLASECVDLGQEWLDTYDGDFGGLSRKSPKQMKKELKQYYKGRLDYASYNATFIPTFIWMWIAQAIITWVVTRIINNIWGQIDGRYL